MTVSSAQWKQQFIAKSPTYRAKLLLARIYNLPEPELPVQPVQQHKWDTIDKILANTTFISPTGCMEWKGNKHTATAYSRVTIKYQQYLVHRLVAYYTKVQHPGWRKFLMERTFVCHTCDNPPCINPEHLLIATPAYNTWDSIVKGHRTHVGKDFDVNSYDMYEDIAKLLLQ